MLGGRCRVARGAFFDLRFTSRAKRKYCESKGRCGSDGVSRLPITEPQTRTRGHSRERLSRHFRVEHFIDLRRCGVCGEEVDVVDSMHDAHGVERSADVTGVYIFVSFRQHNLNGTA